MPAWFVSLKAKILKWFDDVKQYFVVNFIKNENRTTTLVVPLIAFIIGIFSGILVALSKWFAALMVAVSQWFEGVKLEFTVNFITRNRWRTLVDGLGNTLKIALLACLIGIVLGIIVAVIRSMWDTTGSKIRNPFARKCLEILNGICKVYTTVIRGTPMVIQLMIMYYIILKSMKDGSMVATLSFGINSGAYVSEIFRAGIMSIDKGQTEAGRSLGLNYVQTMWFIIAPQMLKNVLPTLCNEFITLLKETSIAGYVAVRDLTKAGDNIRSATYSPFMPLVAVALVYLILVMILTKLVSILERRLRQSDIR